jgi:hypothetical protein
MKIFSVGKWFGISNNPRVSHQISNLQRLIVATYRWRVPIFQCSTGTIKPFMELFFVEKWFGIFQQPKNCPQNIQLVAFN